MGRVPAGARHRVLPLHVPQAVRQPASQRIPAHKTAVPREHRGPNANRARVRRRRLERLPFLRPPSAREPDARPRLARERHVPSRHLLRLQSARRRPGEAAAAHRPMRTRNQFDSHLCLRECLHFNINGHLTACRCCP